MGLDVRLYHHHKSLLMKFERSREITGEYVNLFHPDTRKRSRHHLYSLVELNVSFALEVYSV